MANGDQPLAQLAAIPEELLVHPEVVTVRLTPGEIMKSSQQEKAAAFRALHQGETFVIPNPWDAGSARVLAALGFPALASTSSGFAFTLGRTDGTVTLEEVLSHAKMLDQATDLPVSVDLENGYGPQPEDAANAITRVATTGAIGGSIEDYDPEGGIYGFEHAVERVLAAVEAAHNLPFPFTLTARAENFTRGNPDLDDTIARLRAYEAAGADVLYAPALRNLDQIRAICEQVSKPVNVLAYTGVTKDELASAGATRISVGGALSFVAVGAMVAAAEEIQRAGTFTALSSATSGSQIREWLTNQASMV